MLRLVGSILLLGASLLSSCSPEPTYSAPDRVAGARVPRTSACDDDVDPTGCLLPWPSSAFTKRDESSPTGVRLAVDIGSLGDGAEDDATSLNRADGFSRLTPIATGFPIEVEASPGAIQLFLAEGERVGEAVPLRAAVVASVDDAPRSLLLATPERALEPNAEYVVVVTDALRAKGGGAIAAERSARVSLGLDAPRSQREADLFGYHAPSRAAFAKAGVDAARVLRVWSFTTRSVEDGTRRLVAMRNAARAAVAEGLTKVTIDVVRPGSGAIAFDVEGRLTGLPSFVSTNGLSLDDKWLPIASGTREAPFRVMIPQGTSDYRFVMFGHGTGGEFRDTAFDQELAKEGIGKVGFSFYGWTKDEALPTFFRLKRMFAATHQSTAWLMQSVADGAAIQAAMTAAIGDALAATTPGRRPDGSIAIWAGGSLGGTMGLVFTAVTPEMRAAVLNVPGAGWTHFIPESNLYSTIKPFVLGAYGYDLGLLQAFLMSQTNWDDVDGGVWREALNPLGGRKTTFLVQESIGDPVLPNVGTENVARAVGAVQVGAVLDPVEGVAPASEAIDKSALTQFRVRATEPLDIHGFGAGDSPAGIAAREQIRAFVTSVFQGQPRIVVPAACAGGSCDFAK